MSLCISNKFLSFKWNLSYATHFYKFINPNINITGCKYFCNMQCFLVLNLAMLTVVVYKSIIFSFFNIQLYWLVFKIVEYVDHS